MNGPFPIELSRDITEISPLWELLPFNLSWSPIGSRQSNDWPIVAKHANTTSSRQYKCDARDNYIRIFYFTLNSWWLQCVRSARDPSNRWISISTASPAWAWPTPRRRWTSPTVDIARALSLYSARANYISQERPLEAKITENTCIYFDTCFCTLHGDHTLPGESAVLLTFQMHV